MMEIILWVYLSPATQRPSHDWSFVDAIKEAKIPEVKEISDGGPQPPSEDFSFYAKERPSCFFYVGAKKDDAPYPHQHPKFDIREDAMAICAKTMAAVTVKYLMED